MSSNIYNQGDYGAIIVLFFLNCVLKGEFKVNKTLITLIYLKCNNYKDYIKIFDIKSLLYWYCVI